MQQVEARLAAQALVLPPPWKPGASLSMGVRDGGLLHLSTHIGIDLKRLVHFNGRDRHPIVSGEIGSDVSLEQAQAAATAASLNLLSTVKLMLGDLDDVERFIRVTCWMRAPEGFALSHKVADAASDVFIAAYGDAGRHVRAAVGVTCLPANGCVGVEATVRVKPSRGTLRRAEQG